jgi:arylsulfatase A-like enzyme
MARGLRVAACVALTFAGAAACAPDASGPERAPRGVLLVALDTLRADHLGLYGYGRDTSPEIDRFARGAVVFQRALSSSPNTPPAMASLLTSLYPGRHGFTGNGDRLPSELPTLAEAMAAHGHRTGAFVDGGYLRERFGLGRGFEVYDDAAGGIARIWPRARAWLEAEDDRPFFLFLHCYDIHAPYAPPPPFRGMFHERPYTGDFVPTLANLDAVFRGERSLDDEAMAHIRARYDEGIRYTDDRLGAILRELEAGGVLSDTLVVITSDHGEEFGEHGSVLHWQLYHGPNLRVPLVVRMPGARDAEPRRVERTVQLIDLAPTILDLVGAPPLAGAQGRSLAPLLRRASAVSPAADAPGEASAYAWWSDPQALPLRSVVRGRHQLLFSEAAPGGEQLFDVVADPLAQVDLAGSQPGRVAEMRADAMRVMRANRGDPAPREDLDAETREALRALGYGLDEP